MKIPAPILRRLQQRYPSGACKAPMPGSCAACLTPFAPGVDTVLFLAGESAHPSCVPQDNRELWKSFDSRWAQPCGACGFQIKKDAPVLWKSRTLCWPCARSETFQTVPGRFIFPLPLLPRTPEEIRHNLGEAGWLSVFGREVYGFAATIEKDRKIVGAWMLKADDMDEAEEIAKSLALSAGKATPIAAPGTGGQTYGEGDPAGQDAWENRAYPGSGGKPHAFNPHCHCDHCEPWGDDDYPDDDDDDDDDRADDYPGGAQGARFSGGLEFTHECDFDVGPPGGVCSICGQG